jgi:hypothetical protein
MKIQLEITSKTNKNIEGNDELKGRSLGFIAQFYLQQLKNIILNYSIGDVLKIHS